MNILPERFAKPILPNIISDKKVTTIEIGNLIFSEILKKNKKKKIKKKIIIPETSTSELSIFVIELILLINKILK